MSRLSLARASYDAKMMRVNANQLLEGIRDSRLFTAEELAGAEKQQKADMATPLAKSPLCNPIGPAPAHYGGSPMWGDLTAPYGR